VNATRNLKEITVGALMSAAFAVVSLGIAAAPAHAGPDHWCPGDPPAQAVMPRPGGGFGLSPVNPNWDTNVCHNYVTGDGQVAEGIPCYLPQFQWFQCPPGTTPRPLMPLIPNK
jgi:hypothetical protein